MTRKRLLISAVVLAILAVLVYVQFREWKRFDWGVFAYQTEGVDPARVFSAVALIYLTYFLRAVRWKIFLRPVRKASAVELTRPTIIGFTGLALLGRPGEFLRPYLIARRENLTMGSQISVWIVERIFDIGAFTVLLAIDLFSGRLARVAYFRENPHQLRRMDEFGFVLSGLVVFMGLVAFLVRRYGPALADWTAARLAFLPRLASSLRARIRAFGEGLNTIHDWGSFAQLVAVSLAIWFCIALAYREVMHSYPCRPQRHHHVHVAADQPPAEQEDEYTCLKHLGVPDVLLVMGGSMVGSVIQLPAVGGGSQLATIAVMQRIFDVQPEAAVSCGILLWLTTFMMCIPAGLFLTHREHVSLRKLSEESEREEQRSG